MATKRRKTKRHTTGRRKTRRRVNGDTRLAPPVISGMRRAKKGRSRRRKISGIGDGTQTLLGVSAGVALSIVLDKFATPAIEKFMPEYAAKIGDGIKLLAGGFLATSKKSSAMVKGVGLGLAAAGMVTAAKNFGVIAGMDQFIQGTDRRDTMRIEMGDVRFNSTNMMAGPNMIQPAIVAGNTAAKRSNNMPPVISGQ